MGRLEKEKRKEPLQACKRCLRRIRKSLKDVPLEGMGADCVVVRLKIKLIVLYISFLFSIGVFVSFQGL